MWIRCKGNWNWSLNYAKPVNSWENSLMTRSQIAIGRVMVGSPMPVILHEVLATIYLMHRLGMLERLTWIEMSLERRSPTSCQILLINFADSPRPTSASSTSSLTPKSVQPKALGAGELILGLTSISIIAISRLVQRAMRMVRSLMFRY